MSDFDTPPKSYRSYVVRCWHLPAEGNESLEPRYVVETISGLPARWIFTTQAALLDFLKLELHGNDGQEKK